MLQYSPSSTPRSSKRSLSFRFPHRNPVSTSHLPPYVLHASVSLVLLGLITYIIFGERKLGIIADNFRGLQVFQTNGGEITPSWVMTTSIHIRRNLLFVSTFGYSAQCDWHHGASLWANCLSLHLTAVSPTVVHVTLLDYPVETSDRKKPYESCHRKFTIGFRVV